MTQEQTYNAINKKWQTAKEIHEKITEPKPNLNTIRTSLRKLVKTKEIITRKKKKNQIKQLITEYKRP